VNAWKTSANLKLNQSVNAFRNGLRVITVKQGNDDPCDDSFAVTSDRLIINPTEIKSRQKIAGKIMDGE
jgi:hypothetical protein